MVNDRQPPGYSFPDGHTSDSSSTEGFVAAPWFNDPPHGQSPGISDLQQGAGPIQHDAYGDAYGGAPLNGYDTGGYGQFTDASYGGDDLLFGAMPGAEGHETGGYATSGWDTGESYSPTGFNPVHFAGPDFPDHGVAHIPAQAGPERTEYGTGQWGATGQWDTAGAHHGFDLQSGYADHGGYAGFDSGSWDAVPGAPQDPYGSYESYEGYDAYAPYGSYEPYAPYDAPDQGAFLQDGFAGAQDGLAGTGQWDTNGFATYGGYGHQDAFPGGQEYPQPDGHLQHGGFPGGGQDFPYGEGDFAYGEGYGHPGPGNLDGASGYGHDDARQHGGFVGFDDDGFDDGGYAGYPQNEGHFGQETGPFGTGSFTVPAEPPQLGHEHLTADPFDPDGAFAPHDAYQPHGMPHDPYGIPEAQGSYDAFEAYDTQDPYDLYGIHGSPAPHEPSGQERIDQAALSSSPSEEPDQDFAELFRDAQPASAVADAGPAADDLDRDPLAKQGDGASGSPEEESAPLAPINPYPRGRRRSPKPRRSALLSVAVPSVAVMGVAGVAAASVMETDGASDDSTTQAADEGEKVQPPKANKKLDNQLAGFSQDADDFANRANRTQERIDLKERQEAERERKAKEAARKEAMRPKFALPVDDPTLSAQFGQAGMNWMSVHTGIDFPVSQGTPVKAATDGTVSTKFDMSFGNMAIVTAEDGTETWYCHLSSTKIRSGEVKAGDTIGYSGNSGNSTGPHLHFEVHPGGGDAVDPLPWLQSKGLNIG